MATSYAVNREVVVKFFYNDNPTSRNTILTRTLGKLGVIESSLKKDDTELPKNNEFWRVKVIKETCPGKNTGCFILEPMAKVEIEDLSKLIPGMYAEHKYKGLLILKPNTANMNWILPLTHKQSLMNINKELYGILVDLSETPCV